VAVAGRAAEAVTSSVARAVARVEAGVAAAAEAPAVVAGATRIRTNTLIRAVAAAVKPRISTTIFHFRVHYKPLIFLSF
jgi:hypothetical protein